MKLKEILQKVPDPRGKQGQDYTLWSILSLESLIDRFVEQLGQVFMLRVFHVDTIC